jgi:HlyD family secretion protein
VETAPVERGDVEQTVTTISTGIIEAKEEAVLGFGTTGRIGSVAVNVGDRVTAGQLLSELENIDVRSTHDTALREFRRSQRLRTEGVISVAALENARRGYEVAKGNLDRTRVVAPFPGIITEINAKVGELAGATPTPGKAFIRLVNDEEMIVRGEVDEVDVARLKLGQDVRLKVQALGGQVVKGELTEIHPQVNTTLEQNRSVTVKMRFLDPTNVRTGGSADVEIIVDRHANVLSVPSRAILNEGQKRFVFKLDGGKAAKTYLETGLNNWARTEVVKGLAEGDKVIFPPEKTSLKDGQRVQPTAAGAR